MTKRGSRALDTRRRIVDAAARLFVRDGYWATSIASIADEADVAVPTVYATLRSKANILRAVVDLQVRGDHGEAPVAGRADWRAVGEEADPRRRLGRRARLRREICDREAALFAQNRGGGGVRSRGDGAAGQEHDGRRLPDADAPCHAPSPRPSAHGAA